MRERLRHVEHHVALVQLADRVHGSAVLQHVHLFDGAFVVAVVPFLREGEHGLGGGAFHFGDQLAVVHLERFGQLGVSRLATVLAGQLLQRAVDLAGLEAHQARHPVLRAQLVQNRAADTRGAVGLELDVALGLKAADRVHQAEVAPAHQVVEFDRLGQGLQQALGDVAHQRLVALQERVAQALQLGRVLLGARGVVELPNLLGLQRGEIDLRLLRRLLGFLHFGLCDLLLDHDAPQIFIRE